MGGVAGEGPVSVLPEMSVWPSGEVRFRLLGPLAAVDVAGESLSLGPPRRQAVLAALLVYVGETLSVDRLTDLLWAGPAPASAATMVHGAVAGLRGMLEPGRGGDAPNMLVTRSGGYALVVRPEQLDVAVFERLLGEGRRHVEPAPARASQLLGQALALWRGPALAGIEEAFARDAAARWEELRVECVELRMEAELALGHHHEVVADLQAIVRRHPLRERLCAQLMVALYRCGRQADALAAYRTLRGMLAGELGLEPGPELRGLQRSVLQHHESLGRRDPRRVSALPGGGLLPASISTFVGRVRELGDVAALLGAHRLVTLSGPGGCGKSRLAVEVARGLVEGGAGEAWLVDLASLRTPALIGDAVAEALGIRAAPGQAVSKAIVGVLSGRDATIVFDNCEHLVEASAGLAQSLLAAAETLRLLVTSREPLGVPGEQVYPVPALRIASKDDSWERIAGCEAVALFTQRAAAARAGFVVTASDAHLVLEMCRRLDALPLALELAAARVASMPLPELAAGLNDQFRLLDSALRTGDARHRSLAATMAWSFDLLDPPERELFERVTVFPAAFALDAAQQVVSGPELPAREVGMGLSRLVASSVVQMQDGIDGRTRYRLLETTRQYGRDRLDGAELRRLRERHARHYLGLAWEAEPNLFRSGAAPWLALLHAEHPNFRAALEWSFSPGGDPQVGVALIGCLWHPWDLRGAREEGLHWVHTGLRAIDADHAIAAQRRLVLLSAGALFHLGRAEFDAVAGLAGEQLTLAGETGDEAWRGDALRMRATVAWARGHYDRAQQLYEDAVTASLTGDDVWRAAMAEALLARLHRDRHQPDAARAAASRARGHAEQVGEELARGLALDVLASVEHRFGDISEARRLVTEALRHYRLVGYLEGEASALGLAGRVALSAHETQAARDAFTRCVRLCRRIGHRGGIATALEGLASVAEFAGDDERAVVLLGAASALRTKIGIPLPETEQSRQRHERERLGGRLGAPLTSNALRRGAALTLDELLDPPTSPA